MIVEALIGGVFCSLVSISYLVFTLYVYLKRKKEYLLVIAKCVDLDVKYHNYYEENPVFEFEQDGKIVKLSGNKDMRKEVFYIGKEYKILVNPNDYNEYYIKGYINYIKWLIIIWAMLYFGPILILVGLDCLPAKISLLLLVFSFLLFIPTMIVDKIMIINKTYKKYKNDPAFDFIKQWIRSQVPSIIVGLVIFILFIFIFVKNF